MNACIAPGRVSPSHDPLMDLIIKGDLVLGRARVRIDARTAAEPAATTSTAAEPTTATTATAPVEAATATTPAATPAAEPAAAAAPAATRVTTIASLRIVEAKSASSATGPHHGTALVLERRLRILDRAELDVSEALEVTRLPKYSC